MTPPPERTHTQELVDEAVDETFPASDAPGWTTTHAGGPMQGLRPNEHPHELRSGLRADVEHIAAPGAVREDLIARAMLEAGRAVMREPVDQSWSTRNVECELLGADRGAPCVVIAARYDKEDVSGVVTMLAVLRALASARMHRTLRFAAIASAAGVGGYVGRLRGERADVHAFLALSRLDLSRDVRAARVLFVGDIRSAPLVRTARDAFRAASWLPSRALWLPGWVLRRGAAKDEPVGRERPRWITVTDGVPWFSQRGPAPRSDIDRMAAAVPGLVAAAVRLSGGRV